MDVVILIRRASTGAMLDGKLLDHRAITSGQFVSVMNSIMLCLPLLGSRHTSLPCVWFPHISDAVTLPQTMFDQHILDTELQPPGCLVGQYRRYSVFMSIDDESLSVSGVGCTVEQLPFSVHQCEMVLSRHLWHVLAVFDPR